MSEFDSFAHLGTTPFMESRHKLYLQSKAKKGAALPYKCFLQPSFPIRLAACFSASLIAPGVFPLLSLLSLIYVSP